MVQIAPFIYAVFCIFVYVMCLLSYEDAAHIAEQFLYVSPIVVINNLINSRILKLCVWHKTACVLPLIPNASALFDRYIYEFTVESATANAIIAVVMAILLLIAAYKVFFK